MSTARDVALVLAGAGGTAFTGIITALIRARVERRASRRARVAAKIDEHLALYADYLLAVDDLASAVNSQVDDLIIQPIGAMSEDLHPVAAHARREHERLYHRVALVIPDDVAEPFQALYEALAEFYDWALRGDLSEEGSNKHQATLAERTDSFVSALRVAYWKYEESL